MSGLPDPPCEPGPAEGVGQRAPHHVARNGEPVGAAAEHDLIGEKPEHAYEAREEQGRLQEAGAEVAGELGQMLGIRVHALVGVGADLAAEGEKIGLSRCQPLLQQDPGSATGEA